MRAAGFAAATACAAAAMAFSTGTLGDAPCNKGYRDSTPAERATMTAVLQAVKKALPLAPAGWQIEGDDQIYVTTSLCRDYEGAPWGYHFHRNYQRLDDQEARNKIIEDAAAASQAALALKQPRLDAAMAKMEKIVAKQVALIEKSDFAGAQALNDEVAKAQADYQKIMDEGDSQAQLEASLAKASRDQFMHIGVRVNANQEVPPTGARNVPLPPGARAAYRWDTSGDQVPSENALILVGQWRTVPDGIWKRVLHPEMAPTAAQVMSISVSADPERIAGIIAAIDTASLAAKVPR
jgi:hypothetical protein